MVLPIYGYIIHLPGDPGGEVVFTQVVVAMFDEHF